MWRHRQKRQTKDQFSRGNMKLERMRWETRVDEMRWWTKGTQTFTVPSFKDIYTDSLNLASFVMGGGNMTCNLPPSAGICWGRIWERSRRFEKKESSAALNDTGREKSRPGTVLCGDARLTSSLDLRAETCLKDAGGDGGKGRPIHALGWSVRA